MTCSEPANVPDSSRSQEPPYYFNDDLTYTCDTGYDLSGGDATRTCTASGTWSGVAPTCSSRLYASAKVLCNSRNQIFDCFLATNVALISFSARSSRITVAHEDVSFTRES